MKKLTAFLLALILCALNACAKGSEGEPGSASPAPTGATAEDPGVPSETETTADHLFAVEKTDYGGKTLHLLTTETQQYEFDAEEYTGEGVNDAVYDRNAAVEELLGMKFDFIYRPGDWANKDAFCRLIESSVMANDGAYDVTSGMVSCVMPIAGGAMFRNLSDLEDLNLTAPWWVTEMPKNLTLGGKLYGIIGDVCLSMYKGLSVIFANVTMLNNNQAEDMYSVVRENRWTADKMAEVAAAYAVDGNGDGILQTDTDIVGMAVYDVPFRSMQASLDCPVTGLDENGIPCVLPVSERTASAIDKLRVMFVSPFVPEKDNEAEMSALFASQRAVFYMGKLQSLDQFRDMENDYAVIPFPKFDENQEKYYTLIPTASQILFVPVTVTETGFVGQALEALSYYSWKNVIPQYYEVSLKNKLARDAQTREMLDIIRDGAVLPFDYAYSTALSGSPWPNQVISQCALGNFEYASAIAANTKSWTANINKVMERYE